MTLASELIEFSRVDFVEISRIYANLAQNLDEAIEFVCDPDGYMKAKLLGTYLPATIHFHVRCADQIHPMETEFPDHQIVISSVVSLSMGIKDEVISKLKALPEEVISLRGYCEGCKHCMIAVF